MGPKSVPQSCASTIRFAALLLALPIAGIADTQTTTQTLSANISAAGKLSLPVNVTLTTSTTRFGDFSGGVSVSYWARTSAGGAGSVTVQGGSEFTPATGPAATQVTYTCTGATLGTGCSGTQTVQTATQTSVVTIPGSVCTGGGGSCSSTVPNTVQMQFNLANKPSFKTGAYSMQLTFTVSTL